MSVKIINKISNEMENRYRQLFIDIQNHWKNKNNKNIEYILSLQREISSLKAKLFIIEKEINDLNKQVTIHNLNEQKNKSKVEYFKNKYDVVYKLYTDRIENTETEPNKEICYICQEEDYTFNMLKPCKTCNSYLHLKCYNILRNSKIQSGNKKKCDYCGNNTFKNFKELA